MTISACHTSRSRSAPFQAKCWVLWIPRRGQGWWCRQKIVWGSHCSYFVVWLDECVETSVACELKQAVLYITLQFKRLLEVTTSCTQFQNWGRISIVVSFSIVAELARTALMISIDTIAYRNLQLWITDLVLLCLCWWSVFFFLLYSFFLFIQFATIFGRGKTKLKI